ncbi:hypothetical protein GCM10009648_13820 [Tsukamurella spumae]
MTRLVHLLDRGTVDSGRPAKAYCGEYRAVWHRPDEVGATVPCPLCHLADEIRTEARKVRA